jgi:hypothetical protein
MIGVIFQFGTEYVEVRVEDKNILFRTIQTGGMFSPIEGLKLDSNGVLKEHPDLKDKKDWREIAIKRFKEKIKNMENENQITNYIIKDLTKFGYIPLSKQRSGFRPEKL